MPSFDIIRSIDIDKTYRVARIAGDFDFNRDKIVESFKGTLEIPKEWNIGLIVGASGTGKTTIAKELFGNNIITGFDYTAKSVIDDMPKECSVDDITKCFYEVGFGSVPSWLKPYDVLSNGEKMRCDLARALLSSDFVVFDEFTSVVDRNVAKTISTALNKGVKKRNSKFVAVSCHKDIIEWLQPDWVFDTDVMRPFLMSHRDQQERLKLEKAQQHHGNVIDVIII